MSTRTHSRKVREIYKFIDTHRNQHDIETMCRVLGVARSGFYDWLKQPISNRAKEDGRLLRLIRASFGASHGIYGERKKKGTDPGVSPRTTVFDQRVSE
jgi:putative transposase